MIPRTATLVIPTYKRSKRLRALLECLCEQDADLHQVIVCDDGSPDDTQAVAESFVPRLPLEYVRQEDLGFRAGQARNLGIERATGDVVVFVDDDVLVRPDFVRAHLEAHEAHGADKSVVVGFRHRRFADEGVAEGVPSWQDIVAGERDDRIADLRGLEVQDHPQPWIFVYSCNFSVSRPFDARFDPGFVGWGIEDTDFGYQLHHAGFAILAEPAARVLHIEDPAPRDPFRCELREIEPTYDTYVRNAVYFMDKYPHDEELQAWVRGDIRWYIQDDEGHWVKNGYENDVEFVLDTCRAQR